MDENEIRTENFFKQFGFNFNEDKRTEIIRLLNEEFSNYQLGSSEYLRALCGYLFCIGNYDDIELIKKIKYEINFDIECMVDSAWIESLEGVEHEYIEPRSELVQQYVSYYTAYFGLDISRSN